MAADGGGIVTYDGSYDDPLWDADAEDDDLDLGFDAGDDLYAWDTDAEDGAEGPGFLLAGLGGGTSAVLPVADPVSHRFTVWCWTVIISLVLGSVTGLVIGSAARPHVAKTYHPAPWSCASVLAKLSVIDGGGAIAPVCGASPYPEMAP